MRMLAIVFALALAACSNAPTPETNALEANKDVVREVEAAINAQDFDALAQLYADDYARHSQATPGAEEIGRDEFFTLIKGYFAAFPDAEQTTTKLVAEGDLVAFWGAFTGTQTGPMDPFPATGKYMSSDFAGVHRIKDGKIVETWVTWDNLSMLNQLGLLPEPDATDMEGGAND